MKKLAATVMLALMPLVCRALPPSFSLTDTDGKQHTLERHHGKWVLVNLWATWCSACLEEMPELEAVSTARNDIVVLGLAVDGRQNPRRMIAFAQKLHVTYPIIAGDSDLAKQFKPRGYPTSILYDPAGRQVLIKEGKITWQDIDTALQQPAQR